MKRIGIIPRANWEHKIREQGFVYYKNYYSETAAYQFSRQEIDFIEKATADIFELCIKGMEFVLNSPEQLRTFKIPEKFHDFIRKSWDEDHISFYGRLDLAYDGKSVKLLEFNADTPTMLLEASVIQWYWLQDYDPRKDQFNSVHEQLVAHMKDCSNLIDGKKIIFASVEESEEDFMTVKYLEDCATQAGLLTEYITMEEVSVNELNQFCTPDGEEITTIFKLYPYEWMFHEEFSDYLISNFDETTWIEPFYKCIWSNKMFMVVLAELFPYSPYILKASTEPREFRSYVKKPLLSREGGNVSVYKDGVLTDHSGGEYGYEGFIFQEYFEIPRHAGKTPVIGSWLIGGAPAGIGIRESANLITNNTSFFVPHFIEESL